MEGALVFRQSLFPLDITEIHCASFLQDQYVTNCTENQVSCSSHVANAVFVYGETIVL